MLIKQPTSTTCGQAAIAMALSISLERATQLIGHSGITSTDEMVQSLTTFTGRYHNMVVGRPPSEGRYVVYHEEPGGTRAHWTFCEDGKIYDPAEKTKLWAATKYVEIKYES